MERGECSSHQKGKGRAKVKRNISIDFINKEGAREEQWNEEVGMDREDQYEGRILRLGRILEAHLHFEGVMENGLDKLGKMDGSLGVLRQRKENLEKAQANYWVELVEDDDNGMKEDTTMVPVQQMVIGELVEGLRDVSLKRKAEEEAVSSVLKRRKDYDQDLPKGAGDWVQAELELRQWEEEKGLTFFNFRYDGSVNFNPGSNAKSDGRIKRRVRKALFKGVEFNRPLAITKADSDRDVSREEERKGRQNMIGKGMVAGQKQLPGSHDLLKLELSRSRNYLDDS